MSNIISEIMNEDGSIKYNEDPYWDCRLEQIRRSNAYFDADMAHRGLRWERIVATGHGAHQCGNAPVLEHLRYLFPDTIPVSIAIGLKDGQEPSVEQAFIVGHYARECRRALEKFCEDGSFLDEKIKEHVDRLAQQAKDWQEREHNN